MKRSISALILCLSLLMVLGAVMLPRVGAKENPVLTLLKQPAPPPLNPLAKIKQRDPKFYNKSKPPADDAPIEDILDYWSGLNIEESGATYSPRPSDAVAERIMDAIRQSPEKLPDLINTLPEGKRSAAFVKDLYDREGKDGAFDQSQRQLIRKWLTYNTDYFTNDLARLAENADNLNEYITNHEEVLALAKVDYDRAKSIIDRLESAGSDKVSSVLAKWAKYRNALATNSTSDIETYREQLKAVVQDKKASAGMRDLAMDALAREKAWEGRDDWYMTLLGDETLLELKVNGQTFTGMTTLINVSPEEKYIDRMIELLKSDSKAVRSAAARNLSLRMTERPHVVRALVPMLDDPAWVTDVSSMKSSLIYQLAEIEAPESVPGLIRQLDEKVVIERTAANMVSSNTVIAYPNATNTVNAAANAVSRAASTLSNANASTVVTGSTHETPVHRFAAVAALTKQKDQRAAPALRRILPEGEAYERQSVVKALIVCDGFTVKEQLDGLESAARGVRDEIDAEEAAASNPEANAAANSIVDPHAAALPVSSRSMTPVELNKLIGEQLLLVTEVSDDLARGVVARVEQIEKTDARMAAAYRRMMLKWQNAPINTFLLRDVGRGLATADAMLRLIGQRKVLRENHSGELAELLSAKGTPLGLGVCLTEDEHGFTSLLEKPDAEAKAAMLACARLIRAPIPVRQVIPELKSANELLKLAAERYLESEDSLEARGAVLAVHPGEVRVMGARSAFSGSGDAENASEYLWPIFMSLGNDSMYNGWYGASDDHELTKIETNLRTEIKKNTEILALYSYDRHYIRVYKDRAVFSWDEDDSRYRERPLNKGEYEAFTAYLESQEAHRLPPFLSCGGEYCGSKEILMFDRNGGRRVYMTGSGFKPGRGEFAFFNGLDELFIELKRTPGVLRYALSRELPGLEIIFAADEFHAETVWSGGELRIAGSLKSVRDEVAAEAEKVGEDDLTDTNYEENERKRTQIREKRRFDGFGWFRMAPNGLEPNAAQPAGFEFLPVRDGLAAEADQSTWKARTAAFELRASEAGLFKLVSGKLTKIRSGSYSNAVVAADGRWALASKAGDDGLTKLVRIDLRLNKEYATSFEPYPQRKAAAYLPTLGRFLVVSDDSGYEEHGHGSYTPDHEDEVAFDPEPESMLLIDASTGTSHPVKGELRPLSQQTFRPLQNAAKPGEFWAAIPDFEKNETIVGIYIPRTFTFSQVLRVPKIKFNSMSMWADESAGKLYFTYRGHVLALPLKR